MKNSHILLVVFPLQGYINPCLQFGNRLLNMGIKVTFNTSIGGYRCIPETTAAAAATAGINFLTFSDGYDNGMKVGPDHFANHMELLRTRGSESVKEIVAQSDKQGHPVTAVVYSLFQPWAGLVVRELHLLSALFCTMPASFLYTYYCYYNGYDEIIHTAGKDPSLSIELPGLPLLKACDVPSFYTDPKSFPLPLLIKEQLEIFDEEKKPTILVNTFDALEHDSLRVISKYKLFAVGPLIPPSLSDGQDPSTEKNDYIKFLNAKQESSVVYLAFGSLLQIKEAQLVEVARGILATRRPFLWVIRESDKDKTMLIDYMEELSKQGMIVPWCMQMEVLTHPSLGCFMTHCGWNSTTESLACGVPVVAFPHLMDQPMNAKFIEDVWCTGVKLRATGEDGIVESGEVTRCVETVMDGGKKGNEFKKNALKWKALANEALKDGGCIDKNLEEFVGGLHNN